MLGLSLLGPIFAVLGGILSALLVNVFHIYL
jgi:hypothetical protein